MRVRVVFLLALLTGAPALAIVHGKAVSQRLFQQRYPWAAIIENPVTGGVCAGALIAPRFVITAAHCTAARKRVLLGHTERGRARAVEVEAAIRHPGYDPGTHQFDVGLFRLAEAQAIEPLPLISRGEYLLLVRPDAPAEILGWGQRPDSGPSMRLVRAAVRLHGLSIHGSYLFYRDRAGPCGGDSGGPLLVEGLDGRPVLVGVASTTGGNLCSTGGGLAAYTNIAAVRRFIAETMAEEVPPPAGAGRGR